MASFMDNEIFAILHSNVLFTLTIANAISFYHSVDLELRVWCKPGLCGVNCEQPCNTDSYHSCMINGTTLLDTCSGAGEFLHWGFVVRKRRFF